MGYNYNLGLSFYAVTKIAGDEIAFRFPEGEEYSFNYLNQLSNQTARFLLQKGIKKGDVVAIFNEKSIHAYALMLACIKTGAIYTNLDVSSPFLRIQKILQTCQPELIFFDLENSPNIAETKQHFTSVEINILSDSIVQSQINALELPPAGSSRTKHDAINFRSGQRESRLRPARATPKPARPFATGSGASSA